MISEFDLKKLQSLDPAAWEECSEVDGIINEWNSSEYGSPLTGSGECRLREAWIQHCLQRAIAAKKMPWAIGQNSKGLTSATVGRYTALGDSPCAAMLTCYLQALEGPGAAPQSA